MNFEATKMEEKEPVEKMETPKTEAPLEVTPPKIAPEMIPMFMPNEANLQTSNIVMMPVIEKKEMTIEAESTNTEKPQMETMDSDPASSYYRPRFYYVSY